MVTKFEINGGYSSSFGEEEELISEGISEDVVEKYESASSYDTNKNGILDEISFYI